MTISMCPIVGNFRGCYRVHPSPRLQIACRHVILEKPKLEEPEKQAKLKARRGGQRYQKSTLYVSFRATVTLNLRWHYLASLKRAEIVMEINLRRCLASNEDRAGGMSRVQS